MRRQSVFKFESLHEKGRPRSADLKFKEERRSTECVQKLSKFLIVVRVNFAGSVSQFFGEVVERSAADCRLMHELCSFILKRRRERKSRKFSWSALA